MDHLFESKRGFNEEKVLLTMPPALRAELLDKLYREQLANLPLFRDMAEETFNRVCFAFKPYACEPEELIFTEGDMAREMYICLGGQVLITRLKSVRDQYGREIQKPEKVAVFEHGSLFGEAEVLQSMFGDDDDPTTWEPQRRLHSARAICTTEDTRLAILPTADMARLASVDPELAETISAFANRRATKYGLAHDKSAAPGTSTAPEGGGQAAPTGQAGNVPAMTAAAEAGVGGSSAAVHLSAGGGRSGPVADKHRVAVDRLISEQRRMTERQEAMLGTIAQLSEQVARLADAQLLESDQGALAAGADSIEEELFGVPPSMPSVPSPDNGSGPEGKRRIRKL